MLTGQLVQRLRLFYRSKTIFVTVRRTFGMTVCISFIASRYHLKQYDQLE